MKMTQTSVCTAHFVESRITSGAPSKNTFIVIMVWTMKLHNHVCICIHIGTECAPVTSNSTSVDYVHDHGEQKLTQVKHYGYTIELQEGLQVYTLCMCVCNVCVCI